jgi:thiol-disulfide isomerase/thioredoxin
MRSLHPILCLVFAASLATAHAADGPKGDARGVGLFGDVLRAYRSAPAYRDQGSFEVTARVGDDTRTVRFPLSITFVRPNKLAIDAGDVKLTGDGKQVQTAVYPSKQLLVGPSPERVRPADLTEGPLGAMMLGGPTAGPARLLLALLLDESETPRAFADIREVVSEDDKAVAGKTYHVLRLVMNAGPALVLTIDPDTRLLTAIDLAVDPDSLGEKVPGGQAPSGITVGWRSGEASTEPAGDDAFKLGTPKGLAKVEAVQVPPERRAADAKKAAHPLIGQPAPEFAFVVLDGPDKTRPINKQNLEGKVVVIDFWATWCGPCLKKLPELKQLMAKYKDAKDVAVIALNIEGRDDEPAALRRKVESTLKQHEPEVLEQGPGGLLGLDTRMALAASFQVNAIPTAAILDRTGVVRYYEVGGGSLEALIEQVEALRQSR